MLFNLDTNTTIMGMGRGFCIQKGRQGAKKKHSQLLLSANDQIYRTYNKILT